jgi:hypothetical protein
MTTCLQRARPPPLIFGTAGLSHRHLSHSRGPSQLLVEPFIAPGSLDGYLGTMRQVLHNIEAGKLTDELRRRGIPPGQRVRVVVEPVEDDEPPITALNAAGGAFDWLADEPDLYSDADLVERYRP